MKSQNLLLLLTAINLFFLFLLINGFSSSGADQKILRIRELELVDDKGVIRSNLKLEPDGEVIFRLFDENGTIRLKAGASENGSGILLLNNLTNPGVQIVTKKNGTALRLLDENGKEKLIEP